MDGTPRGGTFGREFLALFLPGLLGVLSLPLMLGPVLEKQMEELRSTGVEIPDLPLWLLMLLSLIQPTVLMAGAVALGVGLTPRLGLRSHLAARARSGAPVWPALRSEAPAALLAGIAVSLLVVGLDLLFQPLLGEALKRAAQEVEDPGPVMVVTGILYGGITEELMMRWGLVTLFTWAGWKLFQRGGGPPRPALVWGAILLAALLFGLGHLPAVSAHVPLTGMVVLRTVLLNALGGMVFGWLFWRRSLEAAMLAHAVSHLVFLAARLLLPGG